MDLDHFILVMFIHVIKGKIEFEESYSWYWNTSNHLRDKFNILYFHLFYSYFTVSAWLFSRQQIKYGSYFFRYLYDITTWDDDMTWRCHETCSGRGVMSRATWQHRDTTWLGCNKCSQCYCAVTIVCNIGVYSTWWWKLFSKSWTGSIIRPSALNRSNARSGVSALWIWASGDVTTDNEARVGVTMGNDGGEHRRETAISQRWQWCDAAWHRDMWCAHWHPTSLTGRSRPALGILIAWLLRPSAPQDGSSWNLLPKYSLFL